MKFLEISLVKNDEISYPQNSVVHQRPGLVDKVVEHGTNEKLKCSEISNSKIAKLSCIENVVALKNITVSNHLNYCSALVLTQLFKAFSHLFLVWNNLLFLVFIPTNEIPFQFTKITLPI